MAVRPSAEVSFDEDDLSPILTVMQERLDQKRGWINLLPEVEEGYEPPPRGLGATIFSGRGAPVPLATWTVPDADGDPITIGIQHGSGAKALERLADHDLPLPPGWVRRADHSRRGLVVEAPAGTDLDDVLWWLLTAAHVLSVPPLTGAWLADVYEGGR